MRRSAAVRPSPSLLPSSLQLLLLPLMLGAALAAQGPCHAEFDGPVFDDGVSMGGPNLLLGIKLKSPSTVLVVTRLEVFTGEGSGVNSLDLYSHDTANNRPLATLGGGTWTMTTVNSWQGCNSTTPIVVLPSTDLWFVWGPRNGAQASVQARGPAPGAQSYRGSFDNGQTWNGPFMGHQWKLRLWCAGQQQASYVLFGSGCTTSANQVASLKASTLPVVGQAMQIDMAGFAGSGRQLLLAVGFDNTMWGALRLPLRLDPYGAPGCQLLTDYRVVLNATTGALGTASLPIPIPNDPTLVGLVFFNQFAAADTANALGIVTSNGGQATIGY